MNDVGIISNEAIKSVEHAIQEEESDNQGLAVTGLDNELEDEESTSKREEANQVKFSRLTKSVRGESSACFMFLVTFGGSPWYRQERTLSLQMKLKA